MSSGILYRFGNFELDPASGEFRRAGVRIHLQGKPLQLLALLLEHAPDVVSREQMRERLWPADTFVDFDRNLNAAVMKLREALDDSAEAPRFVETMPRRGYRFIGPVHVAEPALGADAEPAAPAPVAPMVPASAFHGRRMAPRALLMVAALAALFTSSFYPASIAGRKAAACPQRFTLAVLPFREVHSAKNPHLRESVHASDGFTEVVTARLVDWNPDRLGVISRRSVEKYRCSSKTVAEIGRDLGVAYVVDGTVRREGNRLLVTAEFVDVGDQTQIWSHTFDLPANDLAAAQNELTQKLVTVVAGCLLPPEQRRAVALNIGGAPGSGAPGKP